MKIRCESTKSKDWHKYGGRGIKVCERWKDFQCFYDDMGQPPSDMHSIDRIDGDGDYEPSNCRWATSIEQNNNLKSNVYLQAFGETKTYAQWSRDTRCRVTPDAFYQRVHSYGWDVEKAITTPSTRQFARD